MIIRRVARKEVIEVMRDGRFRWSGGIVALLLLTSLALGWKSYQSLEADRGAAQKANREEWVGQGNRNPHSAAHFGVYVFRPEGPLSMVDQGLDPFVGATIWLEAHYQNPARYRPMEDATVVQRFGRLTAATVMSLLLPLLIVLLTYNSFAGEREAGTLRQLLSLGIPKRDLVIGKALGIFAALMSLLAPATVIGLFALWLVSGNGMLWGSMPRALVMGTAYLTYYATLIALAPTVSALARSSRAALVVLLAFWICNSLLVPRLAADLAERLHPTPAAADFWETIENDKKAGLDGHNTNDVRAQEITRRLLSEYKVSRPEDLPINLNGVLLVAGDEYTNSIYDKRYGELWDIYEKQEQVQRVATIVAPFLAIRSISMGFAGTDWEQHRHFSTAAELYRRTLNKMLNEDFAHNSRGTTYGYFADSALWQKTPDFNYVPPDARWVLRQQIWNIVLLVLWLAGAGVGAYLAMIRIKP